MAEPQPTETPPQPTAAEQKQEAAALSNLSTNTIDEEDTPSTKSADHAALGSALSHLSVSDQKKTGVAEPKKEVVKIKVNEDDLKFLVSSFMLGG